MSLINTLLRFFQAAHLSVAPVSRPVALQSDLLKSVSGGSGTGDLPHSTW